MDREIWRKENLNPNQPLALALHGKNQIPGIHGKNPPRLAPKTMIPQTRKEAIHRDIQERDPNPSTGSPKTKERIGSRRPDWARGGECLIAITGENRGTCGPTLVTIDLRSRQSLHPSKTLTTVMEVVQ